MRPGGGKDKGSEFERVTATKLSLWLTQGARADLFARNVLSGGMFTRKFDKGSKELGASGDLMAAHPLAFDFLTCFAVECKHYASLDVSGFVYDTAGTTFLWQTLALAGTQARAQGARPLLVAKQNRKPTLILCDGAVGKLARDLAPTRGALFRYHLLHNERVAVFQFDALVQKINPARFLEAVRELKE